MRTDGIDQGEKCIRDRKCSNESNLEVSKRRTYLGTVTKIIRPEHVKHSLKKIKKTPSLGNQKHRGKSHPS